MRRRGFGFVVLALVIILLFYFDGRLVKSPLGVGIAGAALAVGYFTGVMAFIVSILFSVYTFILSLPVISAVYAYLAYQLARIHYMVASFVFKKLLKRTRWYYKAKARVKNSPAYRAAKKMFDRISQRTGFADPQMLRLFEVEGCRSCRRKMPKDGIFCPYCGVRK